MPYLSIAKNINKLLGGGINRRLLTLVYGEGGSGKTRFCLHACNKATGKPALTQDACKPETGHGAKVLTRHAHKTGEEPVQGKSGLAWHERNQTRRKACFIDTEGISGELLSLCAPERMVVYTPKTFEEQQKAVESASKGKYGIIVLDSLTNHYRQVLSDSNYQSLNTSIIEQIGTLAQYSRLNDCPVLITTQMTADRPLGGELLERIPVWMRLEKGKARDLIVEKCPLGKEGKINFRITASGIEELR